MSRKSKKKYSYQPRRTQGYVMNRLDRVGPADLTAIGLRGIPTYTMLQEFFNNYYTEIWTYGDDSGRHEYTVLDYERHISEAKP